MQELVLIGNLKQKKDQDVQSELLDAKEDILRKRRDKMRTHIHVRREIHVSDTTLKIKKRQEKVIKLVYAEKDYVTDGDIRSKMRDIRHLTSLTSITFDFSGSPLSEYDESITDEGMRSIGDVLRHITSLISITIEFNERKSLIDEGIRSIGDALGHLTSLISVTLRFSYYRISNQVKDLIKQDLQTLKSIKHLKIY